VIGGSYDTSYGGSSNADAFVVKVKPDGSGLLYGTYLGGANPDEGYGIATDSTGGGDCRRLHLRQQFPDDRLRV
jgi:hypothetical protein